MCCCGSKSTELPKESGRPTLPKTTDLMIEPQLNTSNDNDTSSTRQFDADDQRQAAQQHSF